LEAGAESWREGRDRRVHGLLYREGAILDGVRNGALAERTRRYKDENKNASYADTAKWLTGHAEEPLPRAGDLGCDVERATQHAGSGTVHGRDREDRPVQAP
jgi:hypothetical protein